MWLLLKLQDEKKILTRTTTEKGHIQFTCVISNKIHDDKWH